MIAGWWAVFWRDFGGPVWPNLVASALWAPGALWWHHSRMRRHITAEVERMHTGTIKHTFEGKEGL